MATIKKTKKTIKEPAKKTVKKTVKKSIQDETMKKKDDGYLQAMLKNVSDEANAKIDELKKKFDQVDAETKSKIVTGLSVVAAGLVVLAGVNKAKSNRRKKEGKNKS